LTDLGSFLRSGQPGLCGGIIALSPVLCHVTVDAIPDIIKGKKAIQINEIDQFLRELQKRVKK
jgi:hypothetical protein